MSYERLPFGFSVNVWFELEAVGSEDILTQPSLLLKLSEDTRMDPAQYVSDVLVSIKLGTIASEIVTMMLPVTGKHLSVKGESNVVVP